MIYQKGRLIVLNNDQSQIREVKNEELDQLAEIWNEHTEVLTTSRLILDQESIERFWNENDDLTYIGYFDDQTLLGFMTIWEEDGHFYLNQIATASQHQRKGVGSALIRYLVNITRDDPSRNVIKLNVMVPNTNSLNFFIDHGFNVDEMQIVEDYRPDDFSDDNLMEHLRTVEYKMSTEV